jgi:putative flippase GtrA
MRYALFAVIATIANLGMQRFVISATSGLYVPALMAGTLIGLLVKYILDKRWIFFDVSQKIGDETRKFGFYTLTGVATTAIFWGSETLFWLIGKTHTMREVGAVLGLTLGYAVKYNLDRRFVFEQTGQNDLPASNSEEQ